MKDFTALQYFRDRVKEKREIHNNIKTLESAESLINYQDKLIDILEEKLKKSKSMFYNPYK